MPRLSQGTYAGRRISECDFLDPSFRFRKSAISKSAISNEKPSLRPWQRNLRLAPRTQPDQRNGLLPRQLVVSSEVGVHDFLPLRQLFVGLSAEVVEHLVILLGRSSIGARHDAAESDQQV